MGFIFDIILSAVFIFIVYRSYKRGLFMSVMSFASIFIQFCAARMFGKYVSEFLYNNFVHKHFTQKILYEFARILEITVEKLDLNLLIKSPPLEFLNIIQIYGSDINTVQDYMNQGIQQGAENVNSFTAEKLVEPVARSLTDFLSFFIVFFATMIILRIVVRAIDNILTLPVLNVINKTSGLIAGIVFAAAFTFFLAVLLTHFMQYFITITKDNSTEDFLKSSFIFKMVYDFIKSETPNIFWG